MYLINVSCTDERNSVKIKIEITFNFRLHRRYIQLAVLVPVCLSSICSHLQQVLVLEISLQQSTAQVGRQKKPRQPTRPAEDVNKLTKGLQEPTQLTGWDDSKA